MGVFIDDHLTLSVRVYSKAKQDDDRRRSHDKSVIACLSIPCQSFIEILAWVWTR